MKKIYEAPSFQLTLICATDIITASPMDMGSDDFDTGIAEIGIG